MTFPLEMPPAMRARAEEMMAERKAQHAQRLERGRLDARLSALSKIAIEAHAKHALIHGELTDHPGTDAMHLVRAWLDKPKAKPFMLLSGIPGSGKSVAAAWAYVERSYEVRDDGVFPQAIAGGSHYIEAPEFVRAMRDHSDNYETQRKLFSVRFLVLDDFGTEANPMAARQALAQLVQRRIALRPGHRCLITSNLEPGELIRPADPGETRIDARTVSRLRKLCEFEIVDCDADIRAETGGHIPGVDS